MKYDFTTVMDRRGKDAVAVDGIGGKHWGMEPKAARSGFDEIPMWVVGRGYEFRDCAVRDAGTQRKNRASVLWVFLAVRTCELRRMRTALLRFKLSGMT